MNPEGRMVCHCLLVERPSGLVLVETGLGSADLAGGCRRFGWVERRVIGFGSARPEEAAAAQIERLGFRPRDVREVVLTHLDVDHAGGLADFPEARVHVARAEHEAARVRGGLVGRLRYAPRMWAHGPRWALHDAGGGAGARAGGERWFGFEGVRAIDGVGGGPILLVPLFGHSAGHCGVAIEAGSGGGWLLHCGDAYFFREEMRARRPRCTPGLAIFQRLVEVDRRARLANQARLRALARERAGEVRLFCAHDPAELAALAAPAGAATGTLARAPA